MSINVDTIRIATEAGESQYDILAAYRNLVWTKKKIDEQRKSIDVQVSELQDELDFSSAIVYRDNSKETATLRIEGFQLTRTVTWKNIVDMEAAMKADRSKSLAKSLAPYRLPAYDIERAIAENPSLAEMLAPYQKNEYDVERAVSERPSLKERLAKFTSVQESVRYTPTLQGA